MNDIPAVVQDDRNIAAAIHLLTRGRRTHAINIKDGYVDDDPVVRLVSEHRRAMEARAAKIARDEHKYEGSDFPVCSGIARKIERRD